MNLRPFVYGRSFTTAVKENTMLQHIANLASTLGGYIRGAWQRELALNAIDRHIDAPADPKARAVRERFWRIAIKKADRGDAAVVVLPEEVPAIIDTTHIDGVGGLGVPIDDLIHAVAAARTSGGGLESRPHLSPTLH